jgi:hypothetical protein
MPAASPPRTRSKAGADAASEKIDSRARATPAADETAAVWVPTAAQRERFHHSYRIDAETGCHVWIKSAFANGCGYGSFSANGKRRLAHRVALLLAHGEIPLGLFVCHKCDNPPCVNVHHLFLGTAADNIADRDTKGRTARGLGNGMHTHPEDRARGERNGSARLTRAQALAIRQLRNEEGFGASKLAELLGIRRWMVWRIATGQAWQ